MAKGQILVLPTLTGTLITTQSREEKHSVAVLNPNDGVVYLKINGPAGSRVTEWDWKIPSQSYGLFPGPWQSLGLYYTDLSGAGGTGEINVYDNDSRLIVPEIHSVGRALLASSSAMDITTGSIPANPGTGVIRLWADSEGDLHTVNSSGVDNEILDTSNYLDIIYLDGHVRGYLHNTTVDLANGQMMFGRRVDNIQRQMMGVGTDNTYMFWCAGAQKFRWVNEGNSNQLMELGNGGTLRIDAGDLAIAGGQILLEGIQHSIYFDYNQAYQVVLYANANGLYSNRGIESAGNLVTNSHLFVTGNTTSSTGSFYAGGGHYFWNTAGTIYMRWRGDLNGLEVSHGLYAGIFYAFSATYYFTNRGQIAHDGGRMLYQGDSSHQFVNLANSAYSQLIGSAFTVSSSEKIKENIKPLDKTKVWQVIESDIKGHEYTRIVGKKKEIGFIAEEWADVPDILTYEENGDILGMDYFPIVTILFEAVKDLQARLTLLEAN